MDITEKLILVQKLKSNIESYGKLPETILNKLNYRFRLDWNYYSSSMEGNSLTMDETRTIMIGNVTINEKPLKDVLEMKGHDQIVSTILKLGKGELNISEKRIKDIHKAIIVPDTEEEGILIGDWKKEKNYLYNYKNERFDFTEPSEVSKEIHDLVNWINTVKDKINKNQVEFTDSVILAFEFHLRFLTIHPFYDGNGRTARVLMNLILISYGYPPVIVTAEDKTSYYRYLADVQAYSGPKDFYYAFMLDLLIRSQRLVLDAIEGKDLERPDDIDKKIAILDMELKFVDENEMVKWRLDQETFFRIYDIWISQLIVKAVDTIQKFNKFFTGIGHHIIGYNGLGNVDFSTETADEINIKVKEEFIKNKNLINDHNSGIRISTFYGTFIKGGLKTFGCNYSIRIEIDNIKYSVEVEDFIPDQDGKRTTSKMYTKLLHQPLTDTEIKEVVKRLSESIYQHIDYYTKKAGLR